MPIDPPNGPAHKDVRQHLRRIEASKWFVNTSGPRQILHFVVTETLSGREDQLTGPTIAKEVFGKDDDASVRVEAGRMRQKLLQYYNSTHQTESVRIEFDKPGYIPKFVSVAPPKNTITKDDSRPATAWPLGVEFLEPNRHAYTSRIGSLIRANTRTFFFKGLTGYDLFSAEEIRSAFEDTSTDEWRELIFILTDPKSPAFCAEPNEFYSAERLASYQQITADYVTERILGQSTKAARAKGLFYVAESKSVINLLVLDTEAIIFFRGFATTEGPAAQVIVRLDLSCCPDVIRELILNVKNFYIQQFIPSDVIQSD